MGSSELLHIDGQPGGFVGTLAGKTACVCHSVREKYNTRQHRGYAIVQDGEEH